MINCSVLNEIEIDEKNLIFLQVVAADIMQAGASIIVSSGSEMLVLILYFEYCYPLNANVIIYVHISM